MIRILGLKMREDGAPLTKRRVSKSGRDHNQVSIGCMELESSAGHTGACMPQEARKSGLDFWER